MYRARVADSVFVHRLEFEGNRGYTPMGCHGTRRFRVNLTIELPLSAAAASDRMADPVASEKLAPPCPGVPAACGVGLMGPSVHEVPV